MKYMKFALTMQRKPQQPHQKGPRIECVYLGNVMAKAAAKRRAREATAKTD